MDYMASGAKYTPTMVRFLHVGGAVFTQSSLLFYDLMNV